MPLFTGVQLLPSSVERNMPPPIPQIHSRKNVTVRVDRQRTNINCYIVMVDLNPALSIVSRTVNTTGAVDKINSLRGCDHWD